MSQNTAQIFTGGPNQLSAQITVTSDGQYGYRVEACNSVGCSSPTAEFVVTVLFVPTAPSQIIAPAETGPSYIVSWNAPSGVVDHYDLAESTNGRDWPTTSESDTHSSFAGKPYGTYLYKVRACNASGCGTFSSIVQVSVITPLVSFPDDPIRPPSVPVPPQGWVGTVSGSAAVEGGAATYRIPVEVPPGRAGMAPEISLDYNSRDGNGIAGVGWSLSGRSTIYRCPRTLAQDGGNRTVQNDRLDRLCLDGERLVSPAGDASYGAAGSEYRTEIDQYSRITLRGDGMNAWNSFFEIEKKSGRVAFYEPGPSLNSPYPPETWYLTAEIDRQGNCISYNYSTLITRGFDQDRELTSITYTGTQQPNASQCVTGQGARAVEFLYTLDREDGRTTYRYGVGSIAGARLSAIRTRVGSQYVRRYELTYHQSATTKRSLLTSVILCAGDTCGPEKLPPTTFSYQEDGSFFLASHVRGKDGNGLGPDWWVRFVGDLDGDGIADSVFVRNSLGQEPERDLHLSTGGEEDEVGNRPFWLGFASSNNATPLGGAADFDNDGRVDVIGKNQVGNLAFETATSTRDGGVSWSQKDTDMALPSTPSNASWAEGIDYDGDGIIDLRYVDTQYREHILLHNSRDPLHWGGSIELAPPSVPPNSPALEATSVRDINGDGLLDTTFDDNPLAPAQPDPTQFAFFTGRTDSPYTRAYLQTLGGPSGPPAADRFRGWIDLNGDGLPDIYDFQTNDFSPGYVYINRGGPIGQPIFEKVAISEGTGDLRGLLRTSFIADIDGDGQEELLVPIRRTIDYCACVGSNQCKLRNGEPGTFCGADFDTPPGLAYRGQDRSVFEWEALKFSQKSDGTYKVAPIQMTLAFPVNSAFTEAVDANGDGMKDISYRLVNDPNGRGKYEYLPDSALGPYIATNSAAAPDLLTGVTNGLGATSSWTYRPLASSPTTSDARLRWEKSVGCELPQAETFYTADHDRARALGDAFFTSVMWTVARFDESNGIGTSTNKTCFRYTDAMLNTEGRGFQGFRIITADEQMPVAQGEDNAGPNLAGCGGTCSPNNVTTTTEYYQEFPLTSKVNRVTVANRTSRIPLHDKVYFWHITPVTDGSTAVYSSGVVARDYDATGPLAKQTTSVSEIDVSSGEASRVCVITNGATPDSNSQPRDKITVETRALVNDNSPGVWWLAQMLERDTVSDFLQSPFLLNEGCTVTGYQRCSAVPPSCPNFMPSRDATSETMLYRWYGDSAPVGSRRMLKVKQVNAVSSTDHQPLPLPTPATFGVGK